MKKQEPTLILTPIRQAAPSSGGTLEVLVRLQAPDRPASMAPERQPLRLAVVMDRSGSMSGEPLREALRCAEYIAAGLQPADRLAVVLYDDEVQVPVALRPGGDAAAIRHALAGVESGGNTALFDGWEAGARILEGGAAGALSRVMLLSDGQANHGLCAQAEIEKHCAHWALRGVSTTTVGLGRNFNEDLMIGMARAGGGQQYYGQRAEDLHDGFDEELALLADEVALHRAAAEREGGAPTPADYRHALRDVVSRCIYGVDRNPMAIQLAKTALWLEAYSPDRPLSFVDHHLRVGDALLGVLDPNVLEHGIPDEAYTALSGDDKSVASALRKQNKADLKSWRNIASGDWVTPARYAAQLVAVDVLDDGTTERLAAKREAWRAADAMALRSTFARLADIFLAAFLTPKLGREVDVVPLSGYLWAALSGQPANAAVEDAAHELCRKHSVFHWWLAFPQVAFRGGFDVMLGNPPWEMLQLDPQEFFAAEAPSIANAQHMSARDKLIEALRTERPHLHARYWSAVRGMEAVQAYVHASGRYPHSGFGRINLASLFAETCLQATRLGDRGRAGMVLPSGIATDSFTQHLFNAIAAGNLVSLYDFENREAIFSGVHRSYKFCLLTMGQSEESKFQFFAGTTEDLTDDRRRFQLSPADFALLNPNTRTCPVFRSQADAELTKKLYRATPVLWREELKTEAGDVVQTEHNPWGLRFQLMFMMNTDSGLFRDLPTAAGQPVMLPLYEAKMIHQFDHRWATYVEAASSKAGELETADVSDVHKADPGRTVRPRYWVDEREVLARIARVPTRLARAWLALHAASDTADAAGQDAALADLLLALAQWTVGELFLRAAGTAPKADVWSPTQAQPHIAATEQQLQARFPRLNDVLRGEGLTTKRALADFPKWAMQTQDARLEEHELAALAEGLRAGMLAGVLRTLLDLWMDRRSPRWLMGWRRNARSTDERTTIASTMPRTGQGDSVFLFSFPGAAVPSACAAFLGCMNALPFDFVARQKVGGMNYSFYFMKQLPVLPPDRYTDADLAFIVPRVLELTYTAHDLKPWADDLAAYDARPAAERGHPFAWDPERRATGGAKAAREWMAKVRVVSTSQPLLAPKILPDVFETVSGALYADCWLQVTYVNSAGHQVEACVMPLGLAQQGTRLYLVCRFEGYDDERSLALNRIKKASHTGRPFARPKEFDLERFDNDGGFGFGAGKRIQLEMLMNRGAAVHLLESKLSQDQTAEEEGDKYRIRATVTETEQLKWWLRGFGNQVRVVRPASLMKDLKP